MCIDSVENTGTDKQVCFVVINAMMGSESPDFGLGPAVIDVRTVTPLLL